MRILIVSWSIRRVGGTEDYLDNVIPELLDHGHAVALAHEVDVPKSRARICLPEGIDSWDLSQLGMKQTLEKMKSWKPDVIYAHGMLDSKFEERFLEIAPALYFSHNYYGTCISGLKTFKFPVVQPCSRQFGPACLLHYFPRRCGGRNPITMLRLFLRESRRLKNLGKYQAIVTHSNHMREEYVRHGLPEERVHSFLYEISPRPAGAWDMPVGNDGDAVPPTASEWKLLFVGRMELLKGGALLLDAMPVASERLERPLHLVLAGDGPERGAWERKAARLQARHRDLSFDFAGWIDKDKLERLYTSTQLLVVPSLWPEPFGRIGPEAGLRGVPAAAFAVGGIPDWLHDGETGFLAPGNPPTAAGLGEAIVKCLESEAVYRRLCAGAARVASQFNMANHLRALELVFHKVVS